MNTNFIKDDDLKIQYDLVPPQSLKKIAKVLTFGAKKYGKENWKNCEEPSRFISAAYRHLESWRLGENIDQESKSSHLIHAICNLLFLEELQSMKNEKNQ